MNKGKKIMIVDDSDVDRVILKTILSDEFEIIEKSSGFAAMNFLENSNNKLDALLLDVSMPAVDGFDVLKFMKDSGINNIPVFLITAEATRINVEKASQFGVAEFIRKPFDKEYILRRIRLQIGVVCEYELTSEDIEKTYEYISELEFIYKRYLANFGGDHERYQRISGLMKILLTRYAAVADQPKLDKDHIDIISRAGYFCDIGNMIVPPETVKILRLRGANADSYQNHTRLGAELINLNHSKECRYFVEVCTDICVHHHERYDGRGFPHKIIGEHNLIYSQVCRLADRFDRSFIRYKESSEKPFIAAEIDLKKDKGSVSDKVFSLLMDCRSDIIEYYQRIK